MLSSSHSSSTFDVNLSSSTLSSAPTITYYIAQFNIAHPIALLDSIKMKEFMNALSKINALAEASPGFVWRMTSGDANTDDNTNCRIHEDPTAITTMSIWKDFQSLHDYVYKSAHSQYMSKRHLWFKKHSSDTPYQVLWYIPHGHVPTLEEGYSKLQLLHHIGSSEEAFSWADRDKISPPSTSSSSSSSSSTTITTPPVPSSFIFKKLHYLLLPIVTNETSNLIITKFQSMCCVNSYKTSFIGLFFYIVFKAASITGEEIFSLLPFLFWIDLNLAIPFSTNFGLVLTIGQVIKDLLLLPRPPETFYVSSPSDVNNNDSNKDVNIKKKEMKIIKLERHFETEYGMPSTHTMSGLLPYSILLALVRQGFNVSSLAWNSGYLYIIWVALSRLYMGVHSPGDIIAGGFIGAMCMKVLDIFGDAFDQFVYKSRYGIVVTAFFLLLYLTIYPKARPWSASYGTCTQIFGTWVGISSALW